MFHLGDVNIHNPPIPQTLPKVPAKAGEAIEEAEFEKVADAEAGEGAGLLLMQHAGFGYHVFSDELIPSAASYTFAPSACAALQETFYRSDFSLSWR